MGKKEFLVPYFIAGHPGCDLAAMIDLALYLKRHSIRPDKVQDFIPGPMDIATCMYYTGLDPINGESVYVARGARERRLQRALLQYFKPENYADVRDALEQAGRLRPDRQWARVSDCFPSAEDGREPEAVVTPGARETVRRLSAISKDGPTKEIEYRHVSASRFQRWPAAGTVR